MRIKQLDELTAMAHRNIAKVKRTIAHLPSGVVVVEVNHTLSHVNQVKR